MMTTKDKTLPRRLIYKYLRGLIGQFYKILPLKEDGEETLAQYMDSFQREMIGFKNLIAALEYDELYLSLLSILQYLIDNDCSVGVVRSEVFKAIKICKKLQTRYCAEEVELWEHGTPTKPE